MPSAASSPAPVAAVGAATAIDPLRDPRWHAFVARHPQAGVFHTPEWLEALRRTYGYEPLALTTAAPGAPLEDGVVFCQVRSWLTGRRWVSVPFADHCQPLLPADPATAAAAWTQLMAEAIRHHGRYLEIRPLAPLPPPAPGGDWQTSSRYMLHVMDIAAPAETVLRRTDDSCVRRRIRHAAKQDLVIAADNTPALRAAFYALHARTRRRLGLPPQPRAWFEHLATCFGLALTIHVAKHHGRPVAALVTLLFRDTLTYKYGASDADYHLLGAVPYLLWQALLAGQRRGARRFDLGRSGTDTPGLIAFKDRWAAERSELLYYRYPARPLGQAAWAKRWTRAIMKRLPESCLVAAGSWGYRHVA